MARGVRAGRRQRRHAIPAETHAHYGHYMHTYV